MPSLRERLVRIGRWFGWIPPALLVLTAVFGLLALLSVFPTAVVPPSDVADPVTVLLLDHNGTSSLVLPAGEGRAVRYAYGDWHYYALGNRGLTDAAWALTWPTGGALGRRRLPGPVEPVAVRRQVRVEITRLYELEIDRLAAARLVERLEREYATGVDAGPVSRMSDLEFVHHSQRYTYFYNSNHLVADWMRELGCTLHGPAYYSRWEVCQ